jgi:ParB-like chromosome segregation protein Spo0J
MKQMSLIDDPGRSRISFPVLNVRMVPIEKIVANDYNPNSVAPPEMRLLKLSIEQDGYTQPLVCYYDQENDRYIIVDGWHRYRCAREYFDLPEVPVVTIDKPLSERMASTIRHNRARGKHAIEPMSDLVAALTRAGWPADRIAKELGMDADEVLRLQQAVGLPEMFADREYSRSWEAHNENDR